MDWRAFAKRLVLADGRVDAAEAAVLRRAVMEDGVVDQEEVEFLLEVRRDARAVHPEFAAFLYRVLGRAVLKDGVIDRAETAWLRHLVFGRGLLAGATERAFLSELAARARRVHPDFLALLADCGGPVAPPPKPRPVANPRGRTPAKRGRGPGATGTPLPPASAGSRPARV